MSAPEAKELREAYDEYRSAWSSIRDEANEDMRALSPEGPWTAEDREAREDAGRPCIHLDQINQYVNQTIGNIRKSKRSVKVTPKGDGANDKDAKNRSNMIMGVEERSQAQPIYLYAAECMLQRSYGFALLRTEYEDEKSFNQYICIKPVPNPDTILLSPHYKQPDASDVPDGFILDRIEKKLFKQKYPKSKIEDFSSDAMAEQGVRDWVTDKFVQIAEYWRIEHTYKTLLMVAGPAGMVVLDEKEYEQLSAGLEAKGGKKPEVKRDRRVEIPNVMQYMTNGLEVLDSIPWAGSRIPIISCFGPERWTTEGGTAKRELLSMVRFARDPQMWFDYLATQEAEQAKKVPKIPFVGAKGQFESDKEAWATCTDIPRSFLQYDVVVDGANGESLPPPQFAQYSPNFQEFEVAKDSAGRSIQAAMGISALPTAAARRTEKSGIALERIDDMESIAVIGFVDRYENCFLHNMGWQINELITPIMDTQRQMPVTQPDGSRKLIQVVGKTSHPIDEESGAYEVQGLEQDHIHTGKGEFDVTISTGPSYQSEREEQASFVDGLIENIPNLPPPNTPASKILALAIRMRPNLGPIGQQIADVLDPPDPSNLPPEAQAIVSQLKGQNQQLMQENLALNMDRAGRVMEQQTKKEIEQMKSDNSIVLQHLKNLTDLIKAELAAKSRSTDQQAQSDAAALESQLGFHHDQIDRAHDAAHELGMATMQHEHAKELASQQADQAMAQQQAAAEAAQQQPQQGQ